MDDATAAKEITVAMVAEVCSTVDTTKELESELAFLKGFNVSAPTTQELETLRQEISDLKA